MTGTQGAYKRHARIGPGGMGCPCCAPAPGKARKRALRTAKRREREAARKDARKEIDR